MITFILST